jgi:transcription initiation factor TFIIIB Brf1 subunit/transcription initiation factor TFIIB
MIENPHDLNLLAIALRFAINESSNDAAQREYRELLEKVERLRGRWARTTQAAAASASAARARRRRQPRLPLGQGDVHV